MRSCQLPPGIGVATLNGVGIAARRKSLDNVADTAKQPVAGITLTHGLLGRLPHGGKRGAWHGEQFLEQGHEAINLAILGRPQREGRILASAIEHAAVLAVDADAPRARKSRVR